MKRRIMQLSIASAGIILIVVGLIIGQRLLVVAAAQADLSGYPDEPVSEVPAAPVSARFVVSHRSALNGQLVRVAGLITSISFSSEPSLTFAGGGRHQQGSNYDLKVALGPTALAGDYMAGQQIIIQGRVRGSPTAVHLELLRTEPLTYF